MITRGIVENISEDDGIKRYLVRLPIFNGSSTSPGATPSEELQWAICADTVGVSGTINVGDSVFVGFENNDMSMPLILGSLIGNDDFVSFSGKSLNIDGSARLPKNTNIGDISYNTLSGVVRYWRNSKNANASSLTNPNLLVNSDFSIHNGSSTITQSWSEALPGWYLGDGKVVTNSSGISYTHTGYVFVGDYFGIIQYIENPSRLAGENVTLSSMIRRYTGIRAYVKLVCVCYDQYGAFVRTELGELVTTSGKYASLSTTCTIPNDIKDTDELYVIIGADVSTTLNCSWVKLELGNIATDYTPVVDKLERGALIALNTSNKNLLINSNFAINQRNGYYLLKDKSVFRNKDRTDYVGKSQSYVMASLVGDYLYVKRVVSVQVKNTTGTAYDSANSGTIPLTFTPLTITSVRGSGGGGAIILSPSAYSYDSSNNCVVVESGYASQYSLFEVIYSVTTGSIGTLSEGYVASSDCEFGYAYTTMSVPLYSVDRWCLRDSILVPVDGGVKLYANRDGAPAIYQTIEEYDDLWGKSIAITASIDGVEIHASGKMPATKPSNTTTIATNGKDSCYVQLVYYPEDSSTGTQEALRFLIINFKYPSTNSDPEDTAVVINYAKLELGSMATLYTPPLMSEELVKCQRYYWDPMYGASDVDGLRFTGLFISMSNGLARGTISIPTMRANGTLICDPTMFLAISGTSVYYLDRIEVNSHITNILDLSLHISSSPPSNGTPLLLTYGLEDFIPYGAFAIDAELSAT